MNDLNFETPEENNFYNEENTLNTEHNQESDPLTDFIKLSKDVIGTNKSVISSNKDLMKTFVNNNFSKDRLDNFLSELNKEFQNEEERRKGFLQNIPTKIETEFSEENKKLLDERLNLLIERIPESIPFRLDDDSEEILKNFLKNSNVYKKSLWITVSSLVVSLCILALTGYFARGWYKSSILTKTEIRQEIFQEIQSRGDRIVEKKKFDKVQTDINAINAWLKTHPEEAKEFYKFKEGFDAKR